MRLLHCFCVSFIVMAMLTGCGKMHRVMHGQAMEPALKNGDSFVCDIDAYNKNSDIKRWDIIAYIYNFGPTQRNCFAVKRVIGLPGDKLDFEKNAILLNGSPIKLPEGIVFNYKDLIDPTLHKYLSDNYCSVIVPADCVFAMGDNATHSLDSRIYGPINFKDILGKVTLASPETKTPPKTGKVK